ncbi:hypothetical protein CSUB01_07177 [Colletotrichum sublineola]|uniref:Uncharacterized protein n=1 Tax=Colletotrichum sublineola TaxID=1173701 RepID=A0A066XD36_COLSU|nr:hypothetical protein CSUB01_07177 [Colletotrichum sublineola]
MGKRTTAARSSYDGIKRERMAASEKKRREKLGAGFRGPQAKAVGLVWSGLPLWFGSWGSTKTSSLPSATNHAISFYAALVLRNHRTARVQPSVLPKNCRTPDRIRPNLQWLRRLGPACSKLEELLQPTIANIANSNDLSISNSPTAPTT